jgi:hypothetical protein
MATIFSKSGSYGVTMSWNDPNTWIGGIVPTASDTAVIRGLGRFHLFESSSDPFFNNQYSFWGEIPYWEGNKKTLRLSTYSTTFNPTASGVPISGSFYTYTSNNYEVKIDYTGSSSTFYPSYYNANQYWSFELYSCSIDTNYFKWSKDIYPNTASSNINRTDPAGGTIPQRIQVHFKDSYVSLSGSNTASIFRVQVDAGGTLDIKDSASLKLSNVMYIDDGYFYMKDNTSLLWNYHYISSSVAPSNNDDIGAAINIYNSSMQKVIISGSEVRANTRLASPTNTNDTYINVSNATQFKKGDPIFVGTESFNYVREDTGYGPYGRQVSTKLPSKDEVFYVASVDTGSNRLYVQRFNGLEGKILASSSTTEYFVDEQRFKAGDRIVLNNQVRTITNINYDQDLILGDYNFQSGSNLTDWETDVTRSGYFDNWTIYPGVGLVKDISRNDRRAISASNLSGFNYQAYNHIFLKNIVLDEVKVEAWVSNYQINNDFTSSRNYYGWHGIDIHANPQLDFHEYYNNDGFSQQPLGAAATTFEQTSSQNYQYGLTLSQGAQNYVKVDRTRFGVIPRQNRYFFDIKWQLSTAKHNLSTASIALNPTLLNDPKTIQGSHENIQIGDVYNIPQLVNPSGSDEIISFPIDGLKKLTAEYSRGMYKGYINDTLVFEDISKTQPTIGRVGLFAESTDSFTCTRFRVYRKCAKITLNAPLTASVNDTLLETGVEFSHNANDQVIKLASIVTDVKGHKNLAYYLNGAPQFNNDGKYPYVYGINNKGVRAYDYPSTVWNYGTSQLWCLLDNTNDGGLNISNDGNNFNLSFPQRSITIDLGGPQTFNNIGFVDDLTSWQGYYQHPGYAQQGSWLAGFSSHWSSSTAISASGPSFSGSMDGQTWYPLTSSQLDNRWRMDWHTLRTYQIPVTTSRFIRYEFGSGSVLQGGTPTQHFYLRSLNVRNLQDYSITVNNASDLNTGDRVMIMTPNGHEPILRIYDYWSALYSTASFNPVPTFLNYPSESGSFRDYFTIVSKSGDDIYLDREFNYGYLEKGSWVFKVNKNINISGSYKRDEWKTGNIYLRGYNTEYSNTQGLGAEVKFINTAFQHQNNQNITRIEPDRGIFSFMQSSFNGFTLLMQGCSLYNSYPSTANAMSQGSIHYTFNASGQSGMAFRHNIITGVRGPYYLGASLPGDSNGNSWSAFFGANTYQNTNQMPTVANGNIFFGGGMGMGPGNTSGKTNMTVQNYNIIGSWISWLRYDYYGTREINNNPQSHYFELYRNFFMWTQSHPIGAYNYTGVLEKRTIWKIKNNLVWRTSNLAGWGELGSPLETLMMGKTGIPSIARTVPSSSGHFNTAQGYGWAQSLPQGRIKDHNRWGYDIFVNHKGWVIPDTSSNSWFKFYNFAAAQSQSLFDCFMEATIWVGEETASFSFGFDYYHSYNQVSQFDFSQSINFYNPVNNYGSGSGAVGIIAYRNGASINSNLDILGNNIEYLKKSTKPTRIEKTYQLIGPASFKFALRQNTLSGYVAIGNITSEFSGSEDVSYVLKNTFDPKLWRDVTKNTLVPNNNVKSTSKFRLKGGRMF